MKYAALTLPLSLLLIAMSGGEKILVNIDRDGLALQGYDPVAYFTERRPVEGNPRIVETYRGATYRFASEEHRELFRANPSRYEPQFGGFCAYAVSINKTAAIDPNLWEIVDDRLILQHSQHAWDLWHRDPAGNLVRADRNWPGLTQRHGRPRA